jgi:hypothetical protein
MISSSCPSWKPLFDNLCCSMALRWMIHFILSRRNFPVVRTMRPRYFATPPLGLIDLVRSAPLLLSPSVGRHSERPASAPLLLSPSDSEPPSSAPLVMSPSDNEPPASAPLVMSPSDNERSASAPLVPSLSDNPRPRSRFYGQFLFEVMVAYSDFPFTGTLSIDDCNSLRYIYIRSEWDWDPDADFHSRKKEWLLTRHADADASQFKVCLYNPSL